MPKADLKTLHAILRGNYASKWDEERDKAAKVGLTRLLEQFGPDRTYAAVIGCIENETFFEVANLRKHVPPAGPIERQTCPKCSAGYPGPGFVVGTAKDQETGKPYEFIQSCKHEAA
jgi:hypothetical protein